VDHALVQQAAAKAAESKNGKEVKNGKKEK
jgi:hypothetical protein